MTAPTAPPTVASDARPSRSATAGEVGPRRWDRGELAAVVAVAATVAVLLVATSNVGPALVNDTRASALASWTLGSRGEVALPEPWPASANYWGVTTPDGRVHVNRFPGVAYWAAPAYAAVHLVTGSPAPPSHPFLVDLRPAAWTAALTVAAAGLVAHALLRRLVPRGWAAAGALTLVLGTGLWSVAADALWPHGPSALALLTLLWAWRRAVDGPRADPSLPEAGRVSAAPGPARWAVLAGVAAAVAVLVRPHLAVAVVPLATWASWREAAGRRTGVAILAGTAAGLVLLGGYSLAVFGVWTPTAGYDVGAHLGGVVSHSPWQTLRSLGLALGGTERGVLWYSPVLAVALAATVVGLVRHRRRGGATVREGRVPPWTVAAGGTVGGGRVPAWTVAVALAGAAYLVVQVRAVGHLGGADFFGARVSLETVVLAAPLLVVGSRAAVTATGPGWGRRALVGVLAVAAVGSVGVHAFGAVARSTSPVQVERWEEIDRTVRRDFGDLQLGEVDLRRPPG